MTTRPLKTPAKRTGTTRAIAATPSDTTEAAKPSVEVVEGEVDRPDDVTYTPVRVVEVSMVLPSPNPLLVLEEVATPHRQMVIPIGAAEGTSIAYVLRNLTTPKPLTHELFVTTLTELGGASVVVARITGVERGAFYGEMVVNGPKGQHTLECRPSDAVALALRQRPPAPIVVASWVIDQVGAALKKG